MKKNSKQENKMSQKSKLKQNRYNIGHKKMKSGDCWSYVDTM